MVLALPSAALVAPGAGPLPRRAGAARGGRLLALAAAGAGLAAAGTAASRRSRAGEPAAARRPRISALAVDALAGAVGEVAALIAFCEFSCVLGRPVEAEHPRNQPTNKPLAN
jgi:hypothetical protein